MYKNIIIKNKYLPISYNHSQIRYISSQTDRVNTVNLKSIIFT